VGAARTFARRALDPSVLELIRATLAVAALLAVIRGGLLVDRVLAATAALAALCF